jgi:hypothetical protein
MWAGLPTSIGVTKIVDVKQKRRKFGACLIVCGYVEVNKRVEQNRV